MILSLLVLPSVESVARISVLIDTCDILCLPTAMDKQEGPTTWIVFLGIELDTEKLELRLPHCKLLWLKSLLQWWIHLKSVKKKDLDSLVGQLHDTSIVVHSGCTSVCRLIDALKSAHNRPSSSSVRLDVQACSNILWWALFNEHWNGLSMMHNLCRKNPDITITPYASGSWECGGLLSCRMVSVPVACWPTTSAHHSQRASPYCNCHCDLGSCMGQQISLVLLR